MEAVQAVFGIIYLVAAIWAFDLIFYKDPNKVYFHFGGVEGSIQRVFYKFFIGWVFGILWIPIAIFLKVIKKR